MTGASGGIGEAVARILTANGATVVLVARSGEKLSQIAAELSGSLVNETDMRQPRDIHRLIRESEHRFGRIDLPIRCARTR